MLSGAQASIYSSFSNDDIDLLLDIICKRIKVGTPGLFREQGMIYDVMSLFEKKIHECIKNPENAARQNWSEVIDKLIADTKVCVTVSKFIKTANGERIEHTTQKTMEIAPEDESHYWALILKRILIQSDYLGRGNFKTVINWHVFLNQLHKLLARYKFLLENSVREEYSRPDFSIIPASEITELYFQFCGQCWQDGFESYVRVAHYFMYILKSFMSEQSIKYDDGSMLVGGPLVQFLRISGNIDDVLPDWDVPGVLECYFMRYVCSCLLDHEVFSLPFEDTIDFYKESSQNKDLLKNMELEITKGIWKERPLVLPLERKVSRIESEELEVARTEPLCFSSSASSSSSSISPNLPPTNTLTGFLNSFKLFKDKKDKKKLSTPSVDPTIVRKNPLHLELSKLNLARRGSSALGQAQVSKTSNPCATEPITTPRGMEDDIPMHKRERSDSSPR